MRIFGRNKNIVKTDPLGKPSKRFETVLFQKLEKENYKYLKSKNEFTQEFELGKRVITLSYDNSNGYISSVQYFIKIIFYDLERAFKKVYPNYGWTNWTIHKNLNWTNSWLCDKDTGEYTDKSINRFRLADEFFRDIKPQIDFVFQAVKDYPALHKIYNDKPSEFIDYLPNSRLEKRIINGLILVQSFEPENYLKTKNQYLELLNKYKGNDIEEIRAEVEAGLNFLEQNEIRFFKTGHDRYMQYEFASKATIPVDVV